MPRRRSPRERAQPEIADAERRLSAAGHARARTTRSAGRDARGERRVEPPFVVARVDGEDGRLPAVGGQVRREQAHADASPRVLSGGKCGLMHRTRRIVRTC